MGGGSSKYGKSHGMGGGGGAAKAAAAAPQTREQQLLAQIKGNPAALMQMSDQDAADTVAEIEKQTIRTDGTQNDTFVQRYLNFLGYSDEKPKLLSDAAYEKARKQAGEESMYHAERSFHGTTGDHFSKQLQSGDTMYSSNGILGAGTYWAWNSAGESGEYGPYQVKAFLNKKAKVVDTYKLTQLQGSFASTHPRAYAKLVNASRGYGGIDETINTVMAITHGYNVIQNTTKKYAGCYMVTLARSVLTMSTKAVKNANGNTKNW